MSKLCKVKTRALDILHADKKFSIGFLLPTLNVLITTTKRYRTNKRIKHYQPLVQSIINSLNTRFGPMFQDDELRMAAMLHPRFKLSWIPESEREYTEEYLRQEFDTENR